MTTKATERTTPVSAANLDPEAIGDRIRLARMEAGMKQEDLADEVGVIARSIQNYENGRIPWRKLNEIADALGRSKDWILYGDVEAEASSDDLAEILRRLAALQKTVNRIADAVVPDDPKKKPRRTRTR